MKLRELKLKNFGKFHDKSIQLQDGINVICGENESGKTTIHTFIKAVFSCLDWSADADGRRRRIHFPDMNPGNSVIIIQEN